MKRRACDQDILYRNANTTLAIAQVPSMTGRPRLSPIYSANNFSFSRKP